MAWVTSTDQMGNCVVLEEPPRRIISLVPSQTELLWDLGLGEEVTGITKFCIRPDHWRKLKPIIGGTKKFNLRKIYDLKPDLVIGNKEENYEEGINLIRSFCPVWMSDVSTLDDALNMIRSVSILTDREGAGVEILDKIRLAFNGLIPPHQRRAIYLIWYNPWMGAAGSTFIHSMMELAGFKNVLAGQDRYPELSPELIKELNPDLVLLSSEPFPFKEKQMAEIRDLLPGVTVKLVDGAMFSWYGSRLALAPAYFSSLQF